MRPISNAKWPEIKAGKPDFIKTYLIYSEEYAKRKDDKAYDGWKGLDPALLPEIVRKAHRDGLRVSTHVETATIFPKRKIGNLKDGYEAHFLVLSANPLVDFANVKTIELRIKRGEPLAP
jgi:predicted amidohydrolase YtcJ